MIGAQGCHGSTSKEDVMGTQQTQEVLAVGLPEREQVCENGFSLVS